jgi:biopolymer transport protein ExbB
MMKKILGALLLGLAMMPAPAFAWWNKDWKERRQVTLDPASVRGMEGALTRVPVLIRLHSGVFDFSKARPDGSDLRFVSSDDKTALTYHIERFDPTAELALVWVDMPKFDAGSPQTIWLYYGNQGAKPASNANGSYDGEQSLVLHFSENGAPVDQTANRNRIAAFSATPSVEGLIAGGATFAEQSQLRVAASQSLTVAAGGAMTWSSWLRPRANGPADGLVFTKLSAGGEAVPVRLAVGLRGGIPYVRVTGADGQSAEALGTAALTPGSWAHLAVTAAGGKVTLYVNGAAVGTIDAALPQLDGEEVLGALGAVPAFTGDLDEVGRANAARSPAAIAFAAQSQGRSANVVRVADKADDGNSGGHNYLGILLNALTPDAWAVILVLLAMGALSWVVMVRKGQLVGRTAAANRRFLAAYRSATAHGRVHNVIPAEDLDRMGRDSTLARLYGIGNQQLGARIGNDRGTVNGDAIASIRSAMDAGQVQEGQRLSKWMVLLTIAISGGPFLGLLGTVIGVMITFAGVAAAGDVNINAIAPGIAAALLATVAGLAVAIPALFGYNYLISRIEEISSSNDVFVDEVEKRIAETHRGPSGLAVAAE